MRANFKKLMGDKAQREQRRITLRTISDETDITRHTVYALDKGELKMIPVDAIIDLCKFFDCDVGDLFSVIDVPDPLPQDAA